MEFDRHLSSAAYKQNTQKTRFGSMPYVTDSPCVDVAKTISSVRRRSVQFVRYVHFILLLFVMDSVKWSILSV